MQHGNGKIPCQHCGKQVRPNAPHRSCITARRSRNSRSALIPSNDSKRDSVTTARIQPSNHPSDSEEIDKSSNQRDLSEPLTSHFRLGAPLQNFEIRPLSRTIPCGICKARFSARSMNKLVAHLNTHFENFQSARYTCDLCEIVFQHKGDLDKHLASAAQRDCGFMFPHKSTCTGHHPRVRSTKSLGGVFNDDDHFEFCFRVREWEYVQQVAFGGCLVDIQAAADTIHRAKSASCPKTSSHHHRSRFFSTPARFARDSTPPCLKNLPFQEEPLRSEEPRADQASDEDLEVGLLRAAMSGNVELVDAYIYFGINVNFADSIGLTALHCGARAQCIDVLELLLAHGADLNAVDIFSMTPLSYACCSGIPELVQWFLSHQAVASYEDARRTIKYDNDTIFAALVEAIATQSPDSILTRNHDLTFLAESCIRSSSQKCFGWLYSSRKSDLSHSAIIDTLLNSRFESALKMVVSAEVRLAVEDLDRLVKGRLCQRSKFCNDRRYVEEMCQFLEFLIEHGFAGYLKGDTCQYAAMALLEGDHELFEELVRRGVGITQCLRVAIRTGNFDMVKFFLDNTEPAKRTHSSLWRDLDRLRLSSPEELCQCTGIWASCELCAMSGIVKCKAASKIRKLFANYGIERSAESMQDDDRMVWRKSHTEWVLESMDIQSTSPVRNELGQVLSEMDIFSLPPETPRHLETQSTRPSPIATLFWNPSPRPLTPTDFPGPAHWP